MNSIRVIFLTFLLSLPPEILRADVTVNSPQTITHRVQVQPIRVKKTTGQTATTFGTAASEIYIKTQVNRIMAQIGLRVDWLPFAEYTNDFAFDGSPSDYTSSPRPTSHLSTIVTGAGSPPKSADPLILNLFFVEIVPGFSKVAQNVVNGYAFGDRNGIVFQIGDVLPTYQAGQDAVAHILAHEICHNLGLAHTANGSDNLMAGTGATSARLTVDQKATIFNNSAGIDGFDFLRSLPPASHYDQWQVANAVPGGPGDDPDGDGLDNIIEFMFGLDPHAPSQLPQTLFTNDGVTWTLRKQSGAVADGVAYQVETSADLATWLTAGADGGRSEIVQDNATQLVVRLLPGNSTAFMRLNVPIPPTLLGGSLTIFPPGSARAVQLMETGDFLEVPMPQD